MDNNTRKDPNRKKKAPEQIRRNGALTHRKKKRGRSVGASVAVHSIKVIGTILLSLFLIIVITGSIFVTVLTIYVLNFSNVDETITLDKGVVSSNITKFLYKNPDYDPDDPDSEEYVLYYALKNPGRKSQWVDLSEIPQHVQDAYIAAEDERFMEHDGVDFKRTFGAIVYTLLGRKQGGSTITMQTIKNITGEDERTGAITRTLAADYTRTADLAATEAVKDAKSAGTAAQSQLAGYMESNDAAVADAKAAGTGASAALDSYKGVVTETYAEKTELTEAVNQLSSTMSSNYSAFTDYRTSNDQALCRPSYEGRGLK